MWGPGAPPFKGEIVDVAEAICYPRPIQSRIPIMIGGAGEKRTLRLVARYADACNLFGDAATVRHKLDVLRGHCAEVGRDPAEVRVTHLSAVHVSADDTPDRDPAPAGAVSGTVEEHVGHFRGLAEAGVQTAIVRLSADLDVAAVGRFAPVIDAFPAAT
jgi:alkanesulfonate monooxygenase SsuD/methylene tetrahydromethanopterin reductase-like flavin-dependent oxidoreductase (luciferase family)